MGETKKIVFVLGAMPRTPSGGALVVYQYAGAMAAAGHDVTVAHVESRGGVVEQLRRVRQNIAAGGVTSRVRWTDVHPAVRMSQHRTYAAVPLDGVDVVVATFWSTVEPLLARVTGGQRLVHFVQSFETWAGDPDEVLRVYRLPVDRVVITPRLRNQLVEVGADPTRIEVVTNGIDLDVFHPGVAGDRAPLVTFMASTVGFKGLEVANEVVERVASAVPNARFLAFGPGRRPGSLPVRVIYQRALTQAELAADVYSRAAVFLCTSHSEGWGLPALEAMACGAAVVSTRNGGVDSFAVDGHSAVFAEPGDAAGLAARVVELLADQQQRAALASGGRSVAERHDVTASAGAFAGALHC